MYDAKLKRRPLMTLIVSVIGVHFDNPERVDFPPKSKTPQIYEEQEDDDANPFQSKTGGQFIEQVIMTKHN